MNAPLQTESVWVVCAVSSATHFRVAALARGARTSPPGTTRISGRGASAKVYFGTTVIPIAVVTGSRVSATV